MERVGEDTFRHKGMRRQLMAELRQKGITSERILHAMEAVPRHAFLDSGLLSIAYKDQAVPIGYGQSISQPYTVARQLELLDPSPHDKVLEIGTGSGYEAAILYILETQVFTIERQHDLFTATQLRLNAMGYRVKCFYDDGYKGLPGYAPFDRIIVIAAAPSMPLELLRQLRPGGVMVIPIGEENQQMYRIEKLNDTDYRKTVHGSCQFVPFVSGR